MTTQFKICNCNRTMPLSAISGQRLGQALGVGALPVATQLCARDLPAFIETIEGDQTVVVGCTQERALFSEVAADAGSVAPLRYVNIRETAGWSAQAPSAIPKMAALLADAARAAPDPVPTVSYASQGRLLIIGEAGAALPWANHLREQLSVTVLVTGKPAMPLPPARDYAIYSGEAVQLRGWLGAFEADWRQSNPIDLDLCVRCNACIAACPENAIDLSYQVDLDKCVRHGECVRACGPVNAINFARAEPERAGEFDLVLDLSRDPLLRLHQPPQGYFAPGNDPLAQMQAVTTLTTLVGQFEKPKYFQYKSRICAHGRNRKTGCSACIDICSTEAIRPDGDHIRVEPHLCMGCGACTTVCPTGAISYAYPSVPYLGKRIKTMLETYRQAGGEQAMFLLHDSGAGAELISELGRRAMAGALCKGMPARLIPLELHHAASAGLDVWLAAVCYGAAGVHVLTTGKEAPAYLDALSAQMDIAQAIVSGLGYAGAHFGLVRAGTPEALDAALRTLAPAQTPAEPAAFHLFPDKRNTLDFAIDHLLAHAPQPPEQIALPAGAPFGTLMVNQETCTLCMACTGACPSSALLTTADRPQLRIIERNCVQCGLCARSCPENAITLMPRLLLGEAAKQPAVLNETEPFHCIRCGKPLSTLKAIESVLQRLGGHAAFAQNLDRLKMCGDCRVVDMMSTGPSKIMELKRTG